MQVSWIDEDELRALAARLQETFPECKVPAPVTEEPAPRSESFLASAPDEAPKATVPIAPALPAPVAATLGGLHVSAITPEPEPVGTLEDDGNLPEVIHIRETLKSIRDRALEAGLLPQPAPTQESVAPAVAATPTPWPQATTQAPPDLPAIAQAIASITEPEPETKTELPPVGIAPQPAPDSTMAERLDTFTQWAGRLTRAEQIILMDDYGDLLWGNPETNDLILTAMLALNASSRSRGPDLNGNPAFLRSQLGIERELYALPSATRYGTVTLALINPVEVDQNTTNLLQEGLVRSIEG